MKVLIVGAGAQGGPCASILARDKDVSEIVLADIDLDLVQKVKEKIKSDKVIAVRLDAGKLEDIQQAAKGADVIINLTLIQFNANLMKAAVGCGAHYVDTAFDDPLWGQIIENQPLELDNEFKKAGLTALFGCGGSPGVTNVLIKYVCDQMDRVDEIGIRLGGRYLEKPKEVVSAWDPGWSPETALLDYAAEVPVFEDGKYKLYPPFSGPEEYHFPDPVGPLLISYHNHEEMVTLPRFIGKGVKKVEFRYPVDPVAGSFVKLGFAKLEPVEVTGSKVVPFDVLMKLVRHPVDTFLTEDENAARLPLKRANRVVISVKGTKSGEEVTHTITSSISLFSNAEEKLAIYKKLGSTAIFVALPAVVGAKMCMEGSAERGVISAECLDPLKFLRMMAEIAAPLRFQETIKKEVSIS